MANLKKYWPHLTESEAAVERQKLFDKQNGRCAMCKKPASYFKRALAVDHNHKTGKVRGLVCYACNRFKIGRQTLTSIKQLLKYFEEFDPES